LQDAFQNHCGANGQDRRDGDQYPAAQAELLELLAADA
jgi:hypothetical protein